MTASPPSTVCGSGSPGMIAAALVNSSFAIASGDGGGGLQTHGSEGTAAVGGKPSDVRLDRERILVVRERILVGICGSLLRRWLDDREVIEVVADAVWPGREHPALLRSGGRGVIQAKAEVAAAEKRNRGEGEGEGEGEG